MTTRTVTVARTRGELARARAQLPGRVAVVMTMGALHDGHAALIRAARDLADSVVVTVFVNPLQFGPAEDFDRYPRTFDADVEVCARHGAALVFAPDVATMYPDGDARVRLDPGPMGERFEGAARPGHFAGMLTVVAKLMNLTRPDVAVFGEKDAQQLAVVRRMVRDLDLPVHVVGVPTVREPDGLALSSRNRYLTPGQRAQGLALSRALTAAVAAAGTGAAAPDVLAVARAVLDAEPGIDLDYLALVDEETFDDVAPDATGAARLIVAGRVGRTRLLDTLPLVLGAVSG